MRQPPEKRDGPEGLSGHRLIQLLPAVREKRPVPALANAGRLAGWAGLYELTSIAHAQRAVADNAPENTIPVFERNSQSVHGQIRAGQSLSREGVWLADSCRAA